MVVRSFCIVGVAEIFDKTWFVALICALNYGQSPGPSNPFAFFFFFFFLFIFPFSLCVCVGVCVCVYTIFSGQNAQANHRLCFLFLMFLCVCVCVGSCFLLFVFELVAFLSFSFFYRRGFLDIHHNVSIASFWSCSPQVPQLEFDVVVFLEVKPFFLLGGGIVLKGKQKDGRFLGGLDGLVEVHATG